MNGECLRVKSSNAMMVRSNLECISSWEEGGGDFQEIGLRGSSEALKVKG